jgi:hypothetical protein
MYKCLYTMVPRDYLLLFIDLHKKNSFKFSSSDILSSIISLIVLLQKTFPKLLILYVFPLENC